MTAEFSEKEYWDLRYRARGLERVGVSSGTRGIGGGGRLNQYLYLLREEALVRVLESNAVDLSRTRVLDVGCGSGYWTSFFARHGALEYTGVDVSQVAIEALRLEFPDLTFHTADLGGSVFPAAGPFDLVNAFDVLYHIVDDDKFRAALKNLEQVTEAGGYLVITDYLDDRQPVSAQHVNHRSLERYRECLSLAGYEIVSIRPVFYLLGRNVGIWSKDINHSWFMNYLLAPFYFRGWLSGILYHLDRKWISSVDDQDPRAKTKILVARKRADSRG